MSTDSVRLEDITTLISRGRAPSYCETKGLQVVNQKCIRDGKVDFSLTRMTDVEVRPCPEWAYLQVGDCLINSTGSGTLGRTAIVDALTAPATTDTHVTIVRPRSEMCLPLFLAYYLRSIENELVSLSEGATGQTELAREIVRGLRIQLPSLAEQQRIVAKLDEVDSDLRTLSEHLDAELLRSAQLRLSVVDELFASASGTPTALGELLDIQNGYAFESEHFTPSAPIGLIRIRDLKRGTVTETGYEGTYDLAYLVKAGDLLIGMDGEFRCYTWKGAPALLNQRVCRLHKFREDVDPRFVLHGINTHLAQIEAETGFTTVKHLSSRTIKEISFELPALAEQQRIVAKVEEVQSACAEISANIQRRKAKAGELRQSVLAAAFRGEL